VTLSRLTKMKGEVKPRTTKLLRTDPAFPSLDMMLHVYLRSKEWSVLKK